MFSIPSLALMASAIASWSVCAKHAMSYQAPDFLTAAFKLAPLSRTQNMGISVGRPQSVSEFSSDWSIAPEVCDPGKGLFSNATDLSLKSSVTYDKVKEMYGFILHEVQISLVKLNAGHSFIHIRLTTR